MKVPVQHIKQATTSRYTFGSVASEVLPNVFEMLEQERDMEPEQKLWFDAVAFALMDALKITQCSRQQMASAQVLFEATSGETWEHLNFMCECADLNPNFIRRVYKEKKE